MVVQRMVQFQKPREGLRYGALAAKFNAADFGVPQFRERVFIVGLRGEPAVHVHRCFDQIWKARTHRNRSVADSSRPEWRTVGSAIEPLGDPGGWKAWFGQTIEGEGEMSVG